MLLEVALTRFLAYEMLLMLHSWQRLKELIAVIMTLTLTCDCRKNS